ncbi:MAG TPA: DUF1800 domain-containing protein [Verrucomicrobiae bacterium]|nr:DUF1800 domain-containing protein [Verrucomicrobiae bacterium]
MLKPLSADKWSYATAAHLLNRAGFGGAPKDIQKLASLGLDGAVSSLVDFERTPDPTPNPEWAKPDPDRAERLKRIRQGTPEERKEAQREERRTQGEHLLALRHWWLRRMVEGPRPLQEKLVLFWHGHFATSIQKVRDAYLMWRQNETFRQHAAGNWFSLVTAMAKDPAMLIWLDQAQSRAEHPNENFARELMELFALGEGHYTEKDVTEAARALTGWSLERGREEFVYRQRLHDTGVKTVLGRTGNLTGSDVIDIIASQPQAARFITKKMWTFFAAENPPAPLADALAAELRKSNGGFKPFLRTMFRSEEFYADNVVRQQVKSPVQWLVGSVRLLETELPPPFICVNMLRLMGQDLFAPPNVKGWDGGTAWITTNSLLNRYNLAGYLVFGENPLSMMPQGQNRPFAKARLERLAENKPKINAERLFTTMERQRKDALILALENRFFQSAIRDKQERILREYLDGRGILDDGDILHAVRLMMATPDYQLC